MKHFIYVLICWLSLAGWLYGDTIYLKDGRVLKGKVQKRGKTVYIKMKYGTLQFPTSQVAKIVKENQKEDNNKKDPHKKEEKTPKEKAFSTPRLLSFGLEFSKKPKGWKIDKNPPHPIQAISMKRGNLRFEISSRQDSLLPKFKELTKDSSNTRPLQDYFSDSYSYFLNRIRKVNGSWDTFKQNKSFYVTTKGSTVYDRRKYIYYQQVYCFSSRYQYIFTLEALETDRRYGEEQYRDAFREILSQVNFIPLESFEKGKFIDYKNGFEITIPAKWKRKKSKDYLFQAEGPKKVKIFLTKKEANNLTGSKVKGMIRSFLKKKYSNIILGATRDRGENFLFPGKVWIGSKLFTVECFVFPKKDHYYRLLTLYPTSGSRPIKKKMEKIYKSFESFDIIPLEERFSKYGKALDNFHLALQEEERKNYQQAIDLLRKSLAIYPKYLDALILKTRLHLQVKETDEAFSTVKKCYSLASERPEVEALYFQLFYERGKKLYRKKRYEEGLALLKEAYKVRPNDRDLKRTLQRAYFQRGKKYFDNKEYEKGVDFLADAYKEMNNNPYLRSQLVRYIGRTSYSLSRKKEYRKAIDIAEKGMRVFRGYNPMEKALVRVYYNYARHLLHEENRYGSSIRYCRKILRIQPNHSGARAIMKEAKKNR